MRKTACMQSIQQAACIQYASCKHPETDTYFWQGRSTSTKGRAALMVCIMKYWWNCMRWAAVTAYSRMLFSCFFCWGCPTQSNSSSFSSSSCSCSLRSASIACLILLLLRLPRGRCGKLGSSCFEVHPTLHAN